jgi:hypothetical protein
MGLNATLGSDGWTVTLDPDVGGLSRVTGDGAVMHQAYTWALRPDAAANTGAVIAISDIVDSPLFFSDGVRWLPVGGEVILGQSGAAGTQVTTNVFVSELMCVVPGGLLGANGQLVVEATFSHNSSAGTKTCIIRLGDVDTPTSGASIYNAAATTTTASSCYATLANKNSQTSNLVHEQTATGLGTSSTLTTTAIDTTVNTDVFWRIGLSAAAGDNVRIERWAVKARPF